MGKEPQNRDLLTMTTTLSMIKNLSKRIWRIWSTILAPRQEKTEILEPAEEVQIVPKFKVGDKVGCAICVPMNRPLKEKDKAEILRINIPSAREIKLGSHVRYMIRYPSGFIDWISEGVARV